MMPASEAPQVQSKETCPAPAPIALIVSKPWGKRLKEHRWGEEDVLALRLDMDAGVLAGRVNNGPLKVLASGLKERVHDPADPLDIGGSYEIAWSVDMTSVGCSIQIEKAAKGLVDEAPPDERNEPVPYLDDGK